MTTTDKKAPSKCICHPAFKNAYHRDCPIHAPDNKAPRVMPAIFNMHFETTTKVFQVVKLEDYEQLQLRLEKAETLLKLFSFADKMGVIQKYFAEVESE